MDGGKREASPRAKERDLKQKDARSSSCEAENRGVLGDTRTLGDVTGSDGEAIQGAAEAVASAMLENRSLCPCRQPCERERTAKRAHRGDGPHNRLLVTTGAQKPATGSNSPERHNSSIRCRRFAKPDV